MTYIALYNALRKIPELSDAEAKEAVANIAASKEVVTKVDLAELETRLMGEMYRLNNRTILWIIGVGVATLLAVLLK
ncbi:MAG: hypothetical protein OXC62_04515 [Aestuariivita sp.]|nr:hypothetical protein [Aestuariivita sp.]